MKKVEQLTEEVIDLRRKVQDKDRENFKLKQETLKDIDRVTHKLRGKNLQAEDKEIYKADQVNRCCQSHITNAAQCSEHHLIFTYVLTAKSLCYKILVDFDSPSSKMY